MGDNFSQIVVVDFEYEVTPGGLPNPLCMVAVVLDGNFQYVRTIRIWRGEFGRTPPFDIGPDTLIVAYSAWAEMMCLQGAGLGFPSLHLRSAYRLSGAHQSRCCRTIPTRRARNSASACLMHAAFYGIEGWQNIDKEAISEAIGERHMAREVQP